MERYMLDRPDTHLALGLLARDRIMRTNGPGGCTSPRPERLLHPQPSYDEASEESSPSWAGSSSAGDTPSYGTGGLAFQFEHKCTVSNDNLLCDPLQGGGGGGGHLQVSSSRSSDQLTIAPHQGGLGAAWGGRRKGSTDGGDIGYGVSELGFGGPGRLTRFLRRTHSAGGSKDVPAHALFLRDKLPVTKTKSAECPAAASACAREDEDKKRARKTLAQDMKLRLSFLRRRHTESNLQPSSVRPSPEEAHKWAESFHELMASKYGLALFRAFLSREFSDENIDFWLACEDYKKVRPNKMLAKARKIYNDYVAVQSPKEVNLDPALRSDVLNCLSNPERGSFDQAQRRIQGLLEGDAYLRFLQSDLYTELLRNTDATAASR